MAEYGSKDLVIEFSDSGDTLHDITNDVREVNGVEIEALLQESHGFGKQWVEQAFTGMSKVNPVTMKGFYNDKANGVDALWNAKGATRRIKFTWGGAKTTEFQVLIQKYNRQPVNGQLTDAMVTLAPSGSVSEDGA